MKYIDWDSPPNRVINKQWMKVSFLEDEIQFKDKAAFSSLRPLKKRGIITKEFGVIIEQDQIHADC